MLLLSSVTVINGALAGDWLIRALCEGSLHGERHLVGATLEF